MSTKTDTKPKAAKKEPAKKEPKAGPTAKTSETKGKNGGKVDGLSKPLQPSEDLGALVGNDPLSRSDVVSKLWEYIKKNDLQNPEDKREILADDKLEKIFGKKKVTMFEMNKLISPHLK